MSKKSRNALDLYRIAVEAADRASARRGHVNDFFLALQTALVGLSAALPAGSLLTETAFFAGALTLSAAWWLQLSTYRSMNRARFETITALETSLPEATFTNEWATRPPFGVELTTTERSIPFVFAVIHTVMYVAVVLA